MIRIKINNNFFDCKLVSEKREIQKGMMNKNFKSFEGMLFMMPKKEIQSFWMKNCIIPLDIVFINHNIVSNICNNCPPCKEEPCESYNGYGDFVLELAGGTCRDMGIKQGDKVDYYI